MSMNDVIKCALISGSISFLIALFVSYFLYEWLIKFIFIAKCIIGSFALGLFIFSAVYLKRKRDEKSGVISYEDIPILVATLALVMATLAIVIK